MTLPRASAGDGCDVWSATVPMLVLEQAAKHREIETKRNIGRTLADSNTIMPALAS